MNRLFFVLLPLLLQISIVEAHVNKVATKQLKKEVKEQLMLELEREPILIRVTGYGAFESKKDAKVESKRLMALRASKLDAYRALAERVYGTSITGASTVQDFVLKHDQFGVELDSFIRGARVVSISENKDAGFETVLELLLPGNFQDCLSKVNNFKNNADCLRPLPKLEIQPNANSRLLEKQRKLNTMDTGYYLK